MNSTTQSAYTFSDNDRATERLRWLAAAYDPATREFLRERAPRKPNHAVDLGCGPGHTTRLLHEVTSAKRTTGIDASARFVELAQRDAPPGVDFVVHDVLAPPYPVPPADVILCRHLLAHVAELTSALRAFAELAAPSAWLFVQETESLETSNETLARYYRAVSTMQAAHGQRTYVGAHLDAACQDTPFDVEVSRLRVLELDARLMARLHLMNLRTWRHNERAAALFDPRELDSLDKGLALIESGEVSSEPVRNGLREMALRRSR